MHLWGCQGYNKNLLLVLSSNKFQIICAKNDSAGFRDKMRKTDQSSGTTGPKDKKTKMGNQAEEKTTLENYWTFWTFYYLAKALFLFCMFSYKVSTYCKKFSQFF